MLEGLAKESPSFIGITDPLQLSHHTRIWSSCHGPLKKRLLHRSDYPKFFLPLAGLKWLVDDLRSLEQLLYFLV